MKIPGNQIQDYIQPIGLAALCLEFAYNASELDCYRSKKIVRVKSLRNET